MNLNKLRKKGFVKQKSIVIFHMDFPSNLTPVDCIVYVAKTKDAGPLRIGCAVTPQWICAFVFAYIKSRVSYAAANLFFNHMGKHL